MAHFVGLITNVFEVINKFWANIFIFSQESDQHFLKGFYQRFFDEDNFQCLVYFFLQLFASAKWYFVSPSSLCIQFTQELGAISKDSQKSIPSRIVIVIHNSIYLQVGIGASFLSSQKERYHQFAFSITYDMSSGVPFVEFIRDDQINQWKFVLACFVCYINAFNFMCLLFKHFQPLLCLKSKGD